MTPRQLNALRQFTDNGRVLVDELSHSGKYGKRILKQLEGELGEVTDELEHITWICSKLSITLSEMVQHFAMEAEEHLTEFDDTVDELKQRGFLR